MGSEILGFLAAHFTLALWVTSCTCNGLEKWTFRGFSGGWFHNRMHPAIGMLFTLVGALSMAAIGLLFMDFMDDNAALFKLSPPFFRDFFIGATIGALIYVISWIVYLLTPDLRRPSVG